MFEYNGDRYTEQEVMDAAAAAGLDFDSYISKHSIVKEEIFDGTEGKEDAAVVDVADTAAQDMELSSEPASLATPEGTDVKSVIDAPVATAQSATVAGTEDIYEGASFESAEEFEAAKVKTKDDYFKATAVDEAAIAIERKKELLQQFKLDSQEVIKGGGMGAVYKYTPADDYDGEMLEMYNQYKETGDFTLPQQTVDEAVDSVRGPKERAFMQTVPSSVIKGLETDIARGGEAILQEFEDAKSKLDANIEFLTAQKEKQENGYNFTPEEAEYNKKVLASMQDQQKELFNIAEKAGDNALALDAFKRSYSSIDQLGNAFATLSVETALGVSELADMMAYEKDYQSEATKFLTKVVRDQREYASEKLAKPIAVEDIANWDQAAIWAADSVVNQTPYLAALALGQGTIPFFIATGTAGRLAEFSLEETTARENIEKLNAEYANATDDFEKSIIKSKLEENENIVDKNDGIKLATATLYGLGEGIDAVVDKTLLGGVARSFKYMPTDGFRRAIGKSVAGIPAGQGMEVVAENTTNVIQNFADIYLDGQDKSLLENAGETTAQAALMGTGFKLAETAGTARGAILNVIADRKEKATAREYMQKIAEFQNIMDSETATDEAKATAKRQRNSTVKELNMLQDATAARFLKLDYDTQQEVFELDRQARKVNRKWTTIAADSSISEQQKDVYRESLEQEFNSLQTKKRAILQTTSPAKMVDKSKVADLSQGDFIRRVNVTDVETAAVKANNQKSRFANKVFDLTPDDVVKIDEFANSDETGEITVDNQQLTKEEAVEISKNHVNKDGMYIPGSKVIALMPWKNGYETQGVALHEYLHAAFETLGIPKSEFAEIADDLESTLNESGLSEEQLKAVKDKLKLYKDKAKEVKGEEIFAIIGDAVNNQVLKGVQKTDFFIKFAGRVKDLLKGKLDTEVINGLGIKNAKEATEFVKKFQRNTLLDRSTKAVIGTVTEEKSEVLGSEIAQEVKFEDNSINEQFKAFTHDGKVNNAPESFHAMAAYQYEPLAQAVVDRMSKIGIGKTGSKEQNNFIMDYLSNSENRADIVSALVFGADKNKASSLVGLAKTFDPNIGSFGGYAKGFLGARAIRVLQELTGQQVTQGAQTIDAPESKEIEASDQQIEVTGPVIERLKIGDKISEDLPKLVEISTIQAGKVLSTKNLSDLKKVNERNKAFNQIFSKRLFNDIKGILGKNTKASADFSNFLNNNYEDLSDIALNYIDFQKGSGPAASWNLDNMPSKEEFVSYYEAKDEKASTRGDRKKSLNNAIARAIADDSRIKFVQENEATAELFEKEHGVPLGSEISMPEEGKPTRLADIPGWKDGVGMPARNVWSELGAETNIGFNLSEEAGQVRAVEAMRKALTEGKMPIDAFESASKMINSSMRFFPVQESNYQNTKKKLGKEHPDTIKADQERRDIKKSFDTKMDQMLEEIKNSNQVTRLTGAAEGWTSSKNNFKSLGGNDFTKIKQSFKNGKVQSNNAANLAMFEQTLEPLYELVKNDSNMLNLALMLTNTSNGGSDLWFRLGAEVVGYSSSPTGKKGRLIEWEHAMQANNARLFLFSSALQGVPFSTVYPAVKRNYKVIALDGAADDVLKAAKRGNAMPNGWDVYSSHWTQRYFDPHVASFGGIDPNSIQYIDGQTLGQKFGIDINGHSTKEALGSEILSDQFNEMLERVKGVKAEARYSEARATKLAQGKGRFKFFVPYSAEDYMGLIYPTLGKGKEGDKNLEWYKENIITPFAKGISKFESAKQSSMDNWRTLKKSLKGTPVALGKDAVRGFSNEDAVRVYLWNKRDVVPDSLSKKDTDALVSYVEANTDLKAFADQVVDITEGVDYPAPQKDWMIGTLTTDLVNFVNTSKRADFLQEWQDNVDIVYSKDNLNKLKALYGEDYVDALENMLYRMKTGRNRPSGQSKLENQFQNWINDSVGTVMFLNSRSAVLQTISAVNFLNWSDNNPIKAGAAFANQPQFWGDFAFLFNSDFLKQRRGGLKNDVNADEIAREAAGATNKYKAALNSLLKAGFAPTQIADSFAIAIGGASFYRNRLNTYLKQGMDQTKAEEAAMLDFKETAEESQQSSRPDKVSMEQASSLGRIILAFANTPAQYTRLTKRAAADLINGRGDWKTNVSKLLYYGAVQNIIFTALQQALFALSFDDEEDQEKMYTKTVNGIADTLLRGSGVYGAGAATLKNIVMEVIRQQKSKRPDYTKAALKLTTLSPPVDTKIRKLMSAGRAFTYRQNKEDMRTMGWDVDNPAALAVGQITSALGNVPVDRAVIKLQNLKDASNSEYENYQRIFLLLGWSDWQLGIKDDESGKGRKLEKGRGLSGQKLEKGKSLSPTKKLERGVAGVANNDGTIEVDPNLSPIEREKTIAHEEQHIKDMKDGKLDYDDNYVYWNGKKYKRKNGKIYYNGKWYVEGHKDLPWEKRAYNAEPSTKEIKERKKLY